MEIAKLILDWTAAVAWPSVVVVVLTLYRKQLGGLLSGLDGLVERMRKDAVEIAIGEKFKLIFGETIRTAKEDAKAILPRGTPGVDIPDTKDEPAASTHGGPPGSGGTPLPPNYQVNLDRLAELLPRAAILEAWREVELALEHGG